jgi:hypothetical protein
MVDERVWAVFPMSSWSTPPGRFESINALSRPGQYQHHGRGPDANTLRAIAERATAPQQVYGGNDPGPPPGHPEPIAAEYGGPVTIVACYRPDRWWPTGWRRTLR